MICTIYLMSMFNIELEEEGCLAILFQALGTQKNLLKNFPFISPYNPFYELRRISLWHPETENARFKDILDMDPENIKIRTT